MWFRGWCATLVQIQLLPALSDGDLLSLPGATPHGNRVRSHREGLAESTPFLSYAESLTIETPCGAGSIHMLVQSLHWQFPSSQPYSLIFCSPPLGWAHQLLLPHLIASILGFRGLSWVVAFLSKPSQLILTLESMKKSLLAENVTQEGSGQFLSCAQFFPSWVIALEVVLSALITVANPHFISCLSPSSFR